MANISWHLVQNKSQQIRSATNFVSTNIPRITCIAEPREAQGEAHKMSGMEGGENWSKLGSLGGRVSTLALILEGEM